MSRGRIQGDFDLSTVLKARRLNRFIANLYDPEIVIADLTRTVPGFVCNLIDDQCRGSLKLQSKFETLGRHVSSFGHPFFALLDENHRRDSQG